MAGSKSDFLELELLDHVLGNTAYTAPATVFIALYTVAPTDAGGGTECSAGNYARKEMDNDGVTWNTAGSGATSNKIDITFVEANASWGTVVAFGIFDAEAGNLLYWADLTVNKTIDSGDTAKFAAGDLEITED